MARPTRKKPAAASSAEVSGDAIISAMNASAKLTVSVKRRLGNGDEVFIAPGIEISCTPDTLDETQAAVTERVNAWMDTLLETYPDPTDAEDEEVEDDEPDDEEEGDEEEGDDITEEDVAAMKLADLKALIKAEELDVETKGVKLADLREAVADALFGDEEEAEDEEEADEEDEEPEDEEEELSEADLKGMKLAELQELVDEWEMEHPKMPKTAKSSVQKKAVYVKYIMENME